MSLDFEKVTYVDDETVIGADNLNDIQDAILDLLDAADTVIDTSVSPNILREEYVVGSINSDGTDGTSTTYKKTDYQPIAPDKPLYFLRETSPYILRIYFYNASKEPLGQAYTYTVFPSQTVTLYSDGDYTTPSQASYFRIMIPVNITDNISIAYSKVPYEKYGEVNHKIAKSTLPLYGKKIAFMGDSIIANFDDSTGICAVLEDKTGATVINCAFGGSRMAYRYGDNQQYRYMDTLSGVGLAMAIASGNWTPQDTALANMTSQYAHYAVHLNAMKAIDWSTIDYILWEYGTNDFSIGVKLSDNTNTANYFAYDNAYRTAIEQILTAYPNIQIVPVTPAWRWWRDGDTTDFLDDSNTHTVDDYEGTPGLLTDFVAKTREIAREYQIPCIDDYYTLGANKFTYLRFYDNTDGAHFNATGRRLVAEHIAAKLTAHSFVV